MRQPHLSATGVRAVIALLAWAALLAAPASAQEAPTVAPSTPATHVVAGTAGFGLALRAGPSLAQPVLGLLPEGSGVKVLNGPVSDGQVDWFQVQLAGAGTMRGYSSGEYLVPLTPALAVPLAPAAPPGARVISAVVTGYANGSDGGAVGTMTASGTQTRWGTVAADIRLYPFGTQLLVEGFEGTLFVVEDTGGAVRGNIFDIWFPDLATAAAFGTQRRRVTVLPPSG